MSNTASSIIDIAAGEVGYSRWDDPEPGTKYGRWYADFVGEPYYGESGVPFCAMFVTWVMVHAGARGCTCTSDNPRAYCPYIVDDGYRAGRVVSEYDAEPGDIILFDWDGGVSDHVGIVVENHGSYVTTIEGNVDGGIVAWKNRDWDVVCCVIRPDYDWTPGPSPDDPIEIDGWLGPASVSKWQSQLGTPVDGVVSGQYRGNEQYLYRLSSVTWEGDGSPMVEAVQRKVGADQDGFLGPISVRAIQSFVGVEQDGYLGPITAKAIQQSLNDGRWK